VVPRGPQKHAVRWPLGSIVPSGGHKGPPATPSARGMGLTWWTTGPARVGGDGSTLWVFWNKSALRADLRVFQNVGCRALWVCGPSGASKTRRPLAPGEHRTVGGSQRTPGHTFARGMGLTWWTTGPARVGGDGSTLWVFWNKSALRADLRVFQNVGCRALWVCGPSGASKTRRPLAPGEHRTVGGSQRTPGHTFGKGHGLDLVDDGTRSRGRGRLDVMGFLEQVRTSCGPQSLSKRRMPGLVGVWSLGGLKNTPSAGPWGASYRRGVTKDPRPHLRKGHGLDLVDDGTRSRGR
jgi:hypothetical protein